MQLITLLYSGLDAVKNFNIYMTWVCITLPILPTIIHIIHHQNVTVCELTQIENKGQEELVKAINY